MIPPKTKNLIIAASQKYASELKTFKNSNPVIMLGQLKLDRIDQKILKEAIKLNARQVNKEVKTEGTRKKYEKRKAAITYRSYTVDFKRKLIQRIRELNAKSNAGLSKIIRSKARQLNIHPKNIFRWFHTKEIKKKQGGRKALYPQMQQRLAQFIINNPKMKRKHILRQAKQIMEDLQIPGRQYFNFSKGWYQRFRQRLVRRKIIPGKIQAKAEFQNNSDSDSDFDQSQYSVKKQEFNQKQEFNGVKMEYASDSEDDQDYEQDEIKIKMDSQQNHTKMNGNEFLIHYDSIILQNDDEIKDETKKLNKAQVKQAKQIKQQVKTDQSGDGIQNMNFYLSSSAQKKGNISIFVSDQEYN